MWGVDHVYFPVIGIAKTLFALQGLRFTVTGAQNVPKHGGAVLAINHTGYLDFTYAGNAVLPRGRFVRFMAKESIFKNPVAGPLMNGDEAHSRRPRGGRGGIPSGGRCVARW